MTAERIVEPEFTVPDYMLGRRRLIISTDAKNEADDQYAIVHALLSPILDVRGIVPAHFGTGRGPDTMQQSRHEVELLLELMGLTDGVVVADGAPHALDGRVAIESPGARLILQEAGAADETLFVAVLGPLTDVASALLLDPALVESRVVVVWVGGPPYGEWLPQYWPEFNLANDLEAARVVFESDVQLWQVPMSAYTQMSVGHEELRQRVAPHGPVGRYLVDQLLEFSTRAPIRLESHSLGDTPGIGLVIHPGAASWRAQSPVTIGDGFGYTPTDRGARIRVVEHLDARFMLNDFFAKIGAFAADDRTPHLE